MSQMAAEERQLGAARDYAAQPTRACVAAAKDGTLGFAAHVTPEQIAEYIVTQQSLADAIERGDLDSNFTVRQLMHFYLTGESVPFLSQTKEIEK